MRKSSRKSFRSLALLSGLSLASTVSAQYALKNEEFTTDPGWIGQNNQTPPHNFGWSSTTNLCGAGTGEMGGSFERANPPLVYYADDVGTMSMFDFANMHFSGVMRVDASSPSHLFGFFKDPETGSNSDGGDPASFLGIGVDGGGGQASVFMMGSPLLPVNGGIESAGVGDITTGDGVVHTFDLSYDAGTSIATLRFDNLPEVQISCATMVGDGVEFNRFGLFPTPISGGSTDTVFYDNLTYSTALGGSTSHRWDVDSSGDWNTAGNWESASPNTADADVYFLGAIGSARTVFTDSNVTAGSLKFNNANSYQLAGNGSLTLDVTSGSAGIEVLGGHHKINLPTTLSDNTVVNLLPGSSLTMGDPTTLASGITVTKDNLGTLTFLSSLTAAGPATLKLNGGVTNLAVSVSASNLSVVLDPSTLNVGANTTLGAMTMNLGGNTVNVGRDRSGGNVPAKLTVSSLTVTGGGSSNVLNNTLGNNAMVVSGALDVQASSTLVKQGPGVLKTNSISVNASGQLDMTDGDAIIQTTPIATVGALITSGYASGAWNGNGINSSSAAADATKALGFATSSDTGITSLGGESASGSEVIVRYTFSGDANLDRIVDTVDFNLLAASFSQGGKLWFDGDFNYDGIVDTVDFNLLASNFAKPFPASGGDGLGALVPEPGSAIMLAVGAAALIRRRRRN